MFDDISYGVEGVTRSCSCVSESQGTADIVAVNMGARQMLAASLDHQRNQDILFRIPYFAAVWRDLNELHCPQTDRDRLALLETYDHVKIGIRVTRFRN